MNTLSHDTASHTPAAHPWLSGRIVVGLDGSAGGREALRHAVQLALVGGSSIEAIAVWQPPVVLGPVWTALPWSASAEARDMVQQEITEMFGYDIPERFTAGVREGGAADVLIEASRGADLLVVGSRGHGGFAGLLLGSVSSACAEHAECPVLVVHNPHPSVHNPPVPPNRDE